MMMEEMISGMITMPITTRSTMMMAIQLDSTIRSIHLGKALAF